jgi:hypothetical protein
MVGKKPDFATTLPKGKKFHKKIYLTADDIRAYYYNLFPLLRLLRARRLAAKRNKGRFDWKGFRLSRNNLEQSAFIPGLHQSAQYYKKIRTGASEEIVESQGGSEQRQVASEQKAQQRKFFFELGTELIVYGRTEPDAEVFHGDKKVPLRKDGTFSMRFALPDGGDIPLDFTALSHDKLEQRKIITSVHRRKTIYVP